MLSVVKIPERKFPVRSIHTKLVKLQIKVQALCVFFEESVVRMWFISPSSGCPFFFFFLECLRSQNGHQKVFNILQSSREIYIYEGYKIFISKLQPSVKALTSCCHRKGHGRREPGKVWAKRKLTTKHWLIHYDCYCFIYNNSFKSPEFQLFF